ncbi:hypothetical protein MXB_1790 [Myxobolus squamalis]|nr:hypothetical protein MXB_1790 [Myxobolus squamalis]
MLVRCGVGKLILFDYDHVELANMNRLFYRRKHCGMSKVDAASKVLKYFIACNELKVVWFESGVSEDAVSGHIQLIHPGRTACYACIPPLLVASNTDERTLKRDGVCSASLPTTMSIISGLLVQNALKYLLEFGEISNHVGYNALSDYFNQLNFKPNPECFDSNCKSNQIEYQKGKMSLENLIDTIPEPEIIKPENPWGIKLIDDDIHSSQDYLLSNSFNIRNDETLEDLMTNLKIINSS